MANSSDSRQRRRVPISCLNCRRRKVKCDKQKPACGGCMRNGVSHLCEYLDPHWTSGNHTPDLGVEDRNLDSDRHIEELRQVKISNERVIHNQRKEIEDLKRQLSFNNQLSTDHTHNKKDDKTNNAILILTKLNPLLINNKEVLEVENVSHLAVKQKGINKPNNRLDLYSWISAIRLDPKLSNLWNKINNMQKIYHMYKQSKQSKITAIDFTYISKPNSPSSDAHKCPVVSCDMNFMDDAQSPELYYSGWEKLFSSIETPVNDDDFEKFSNCNLRYGKLVQKLWSCLLRSGKGSKDMTASQLMFLLDYYFNEKDALTSRHLTTLFKDDIYSVFVVRDEGQLIFQFGTGLEDMNEVEALFFYLIRGLYLVLLVLIVDETFEILRLNVRNGVYSDRMMKFQALFPDEIQGTHIPNKVGQMLTAVDAYLATCFKCRDNNVFIHRSLVASTVLVMMQKTLATHTKDNLEITDSTRLRSFKLLLSVVFDDKCTIDIWRNPIHIVFPNNDSKKKIKDLRIHLCFVWSELIKFVNGFSFRLNKIYVVDQELNELISRAYSRIEEVQLHENHVKYIQGLKTTDFDTLATSLQINYLIANVHISLTRGASNLFGSKLTIKDLDGLIGECGSWLEDQRLTRIPAFLQSELKMFLHFSNIYITYIMFLQCEEAKIESLKESLIITIFIKIDALFKEANVILDKNLKESQYLYTCLSEIFTLLIQILVAILLRVCHRSKEKNETLIKQLSSFYYSMSQSVLETEKEMKDLVRSQLSRNVSSTIKRLHELILPSKTHTNKLLKLWDFYLNVLGSAKTYDFNYNKLHANIPGFSKLLNSDSPTISFGKCPVVHQQPAPAAPGKCPIDHSQFKNMKRPVMAPLQPAAKKAKLDTDSFQPPMHPPTMADHPMFAPDQPIPSAIIDEGVLDLNMDFNPNINNFSNLDLNFLNGLTSFEAFGTADHDHNDNMTNLNIENAFQ